MEAIVAVEHKLGGYLNSKNTEQFLVVLLLEKWTSFFRTLRTSPSFFTSESIPKDCTHNGLPVGLNAKSKLCCHNSVICDFYLSGKSHHGVSSPPVSIASHQTDLCTCRQCELTVSTTTCTHAHIHVATDLKAATITSDRLFLQVVIHKSFHTYMFRAHTTSNWILFSLNWYSFREDIFLWRIGGVLKGNFLTLSIQIEC